MNETDSSITQMRGAVYRLLAMLWASELTLPSLQVLTSDPVRTLWMSCGGNDPDGLEQQLEHLAENYCRLFIGPAGHLPPIQSVWTSGELQSDVATSLGEIAECCGFESPWSDLLPDHLANELQLMSLALAKTSLESEPTSVAAAQDLTGTLFASHIQWAIPFLQQVRDRDVDGFYCHLAAITHSFITSESACLNETPENDHD